MPECPETDLAVHEAEKAITGGENMADREKVVKELEFCLNVGECTVCEYSKGRMFTTCRHIIEDAEELLKEQKAKNGYWINPTSQDCHCSECGEQPVHEPGESVPLYDFCPYCGAKMEVKWE